MPRLYILLPTYNRREITNHFISCLLKQTYTNYHLVLIDDKSSDGTVNLVKSRIEEEKLTIISGNGRLFWAGALQRGYKWLCQRRHKILPDDICLIINDDTEFENDFLDLGYRLLQKHKKSLLLSKGYGKYSHTLFNNGMTCTWKSYNIRPANGVSEINCFETMGLFLRVYDFFKIGGFHPFLIPHYLSDYEFTVRAFQKKYKLTMSDNLRLYFNENTTKNIPITKSTISSYIINIFAKKSPHNLFSVIFFIILRCKPRKYLLKDLCIVFGSYVMAFYHLLIKEITS